MTPFACAAASTVNIDVAGTTAAVLICREGVRQIRVMNNGTATVWINFGKSTVTATTAAGMPVGPGVTEVLTVKQSDAPIYAAAIAAGATGKIYFTPGSGI